MPAARFMTPDECAAWYWTIEPATEQEHLAWLLLRWRVDPVCFAVEALRIILQRYQAHILLDLNDAPQDLYDFYELDSTNPKNQVVVPSGHGLGKTRVEAVATWHHQLTHAFSKRLITAPTSDQITGQLFGEIRKMRRRLAKNWPLLAADWEVMSDSIRHKNADYADWSTIARTSRPDSPESMQGAHALDADDEEGQLAALFGEVIDEVPTGGIMVIVEEASGVADSTRETLEGALSEEGAKLLAVGNPTRPTGWFADAMDNRERYAIHSLDCRMSDRTKRYTLPYRDFGGNEHTLSMRGFVSPTYWENILRECDGDEDHDRVRVRVRGMKPRSATEQVIRTAWVEDAEKRAPDAESVAEPPIIGLDFGLTSDKHGIACRQGYNVRDVDEWLKSDDPAQITLEAANRAIKWQELYGAKYIIGDSNGVGRGAMEYLAKYYAERPELNVQVIFFNAGAGAMDSKRYMRRRDEMWHGRGRVFFANPRTSIPVFPGLKKQLTVVEFHEDAANRVRVDTKTEVYDLTNERSGNAADAVLQTLMVHVPRQEPKPVAKPVHPPVFQRHFDMLRRQRAAETGVFIR
ncbi:MAG: hypothetical protein RLW61_14335 [Gammaproteobacteria bacterium]